MLIMAGNIRFQALHVNSSLSYSTRSYAPGQMISGYHLLCFTENTRLLQLIFIYQELCRQVFKNPADLYCLLTENQKSLQEIG